MRVVPACVAACAVALAGAAGLLASGGWASGAAAPAVTRISVNGNGSGRVFDGVGAVLGGGGNARYLEEYPRRERDQIMDYLFKPDYGASLQVLKLEIGGGADSSSGSEASVEPVQGQVNCDAGYEFAIARQAVAVNPDLRLYALQWAAPGWVRSGSMSRFSGKDIAYLLTYLGCAKRHGLRIGYLGGWNESDTGTHAAWFHQLRQALNAHGYRRIQIVAADSAKWHYVGDPDVAIVGTHDVCGFPTGIAGPQTTCGSPWSKNGGSSASAQPMWASELGSIDAGAQRGCVIPCAPAMDRAMVRGYVDARLTGFLEWPVLDAMPPGVPFENRGLVTADSPWSGSYQVDAMTWAIAQFTQVAWPPSVANPGGWHFLNRGSGFLGGSRADGSYVSLVRSHGTGWSTIIEATTARTVQKAEFRVTGGRHLATRTVHVWASDFNFATSSPSRWFVRQPSIHPGRGGRFALTIRPGWVYSLTTTSGQHKGTASGKAATPFPLPYTSTLGTSGLAGGNDDEPPYLAAQDGSFELAPCLTVAGAPRRGKAAPGQMCTEQETAGTPIYWHQKEAATRYPYATIGDDSMRNYAVSVDALLTQQDSSAGLIARYGCRMTLPHIARFDGYVFDVTQAGAWTLTSGANTKPTEHANPCAITTGPRHAATLASGQLARPLGVRAWHRLTLSVSGPEITASVDGTVVATVTSASWTYGPAGIEAGKGSGNWPQDQYRDLSITRVP
jgi:hypothetical protein